MRILVVSDTHGNDSSLRRAILAQPKAEVVIHLGDGEEELLRAKRAFPEKMFLAGAQVALYGHTHNALEDYDDGLYLLNPGSLNSWEATYGTVDITPQGIVTNIVKLP